MTPASYLPAAERPNIVVILSDDMGYSDIGCYGGEIDTPTLNQLAENGLRYSQFYNTGRCCPTRASLLTGLYPHQAGVGWMMTDRGHPGYRGDLNRTSVTIAEVLKPAGYATYAVGKWHVTPHIQPEGPKHNWPMQRGFDRFYGTITGAGSFFDPGTLTRDNEMVSPFADPEYQPETYYYTNAISDHAVRFMREHEEQSDQPFFMYVAYTAAHWPMHALEKDIAKYAGHYDAGYEATRARRLARVRDLGLINPEWELTPLVGDWQQVEHREWEARCMEVYAAMIDSLDQGIGSIVAELDRQGELDNTLILFLQDNGGCQEGVGRKGNWKRPVEPSKPVIADDAIRLDVIPKQDRAGVPTLQGPGIMPGPADTYIAYGINWANVSNTPFREYKHFVHEGGISTPLIAHWPAGISRRGEIEHQPGHLIDIMATCIDLAEADYPEVVGDHRIQPPEGLSLVPTFSGDDLDREAIYWEHEGNRAIRVGDWKLVAKENKPWELYDMRADRTEMHDLASQHPERVEQLAAKWDTWAERAQVLPLGGWRGSPKSVKFSQKRRFNLSADANLPRNAAPYVAQRAFEIDVNLKEWAAEGVLVAHGGSAQGYVLYLTDGRPAFAIRRNGELSTIVGPPQTEASSVAVRVDGSGLVTLKANGRDVQSGQLPGLLGSMPQDGLQVGRDEAGQVGNYQGEFPFGGVIESVHIKVAK